MSDTQGPQPSSPKRPLLRETGSSPEPEQQRLMQVALVLLLVCLAVVLYRDRGFWFPDAAEDVAQQSLQGAPSGVTTMAIQKPRNSPPSKKIKSRSGADRAVQRRTISADQDQAPLPPTTIRRTVLPPLEVEVVAGSGHRTVRPGSNSLKIDLGRDESPDPWGEVPAQEEGAVNLATNAAERTTILADPPDVVAQTVQPGYPLLARQMKVQGSVILQALIGRDGLIQNIHVISGPPILASAAQEAVKQWHFKPHYEGAEAVETQAKITVNFIISTN